MKLLCTNDWHFARRNPASRIDDYNAELFAAIEQIAKLARLAKVSAVLIAGDIFHDKGSARWDVVVRLLEWAWGLQQDGIHVLSIAGNHDELHDRFDSSATPYGALTSSSLFRDVSRGYKILTAMDGPEVGPKVYGVPWPDGSKPDAFDALPADVEVVMAHGFATPEGQERWGCYCHKYDDLAIKAPQVRLWHFGHDHTDHGVYVLKNRAKVVNIGALCRGALDHDSILRQPKVALVDLSGAEPTVVQVELKVPTAEEIFDLNLHRQRTEERAQLEHYLAQLSQGMEGVIDVDYHKVLAAMTLPENVRTQVQSYIERAETYAV